MILYYISKNPDGMEKNQTSGIKKVEFHIIFIKKLFNIYAKKSCINNILIYVYSLYKKSFPREKEELVSRWDGKEKRNCFLVFVKVESSSPKRGIGKEGGGGWWLISFKLRKLDYSKFWCYYLILSSNDVYLVSCFFLLFHGTTKKLAINLSYFYRFSNLELFSIYQFLYATFLCFVNVI